MSMVKFKVNYILVFIYIHQPNPAPGFQAAERAGNLYHSGKNSSANSIIIGRKRTWNGLDFSGNG